MSASLILCVNSENEINNDKPGFLNELVSSRSLDKGYISQVAVSRQTG